MTNFQIFASELPYPELTVYSVSRGDVIALTDDYAGRESETTAIMQYSYQSYILKEKYPDREIRTFDTKSISLGAGFQVRYAAEKYLKGASIDELEAYLTELSAHTVVYFVVDDLVYLKRGGRISALTATFGTLLGIKPLISIMPDGSLKSVGKIKGAKRVVSEFIRLMKEHNCDTQNYRVEVLQADCPETGDALVSALKEEFGENIKVNCQIVGPVIASHCGPGTLGVIFYGDKEI